ncbi:hypothetical protein FE394_13375 [Xenorhabdus sp. Reich]|uniref:Uncharacterized protein n=1 Tax=Xenorhabdus littoralis TaxID=2582835 RepID=A0ABU4SNC5_9GAMM|nr:hypothetical protein [Xenorhabdus sp. Reich]MDX8000164.1 hypothetical protein [Xenorhabdus sp. Reich]
MRLYLHPFRASNIADDHALAHSHGGYGRQGQGNRRIATRDEKTVQNYLSMVKLGCIRQDGKKHFPLAGFGDHLC